LEVVNLTEKDCQDRRDKALDRLNMSLDEARGQWDDCRCCLINGNWHQLTDLNEVRDMDYLLGEGDYA
jgi:hypothetical protein